jgi:hypothetical protein
MDALRFVPIRSKDRKSRVDQQVATVRVCRREYEFVSLSEALGEAWSVNESVSEAVSEGVNEARQKRRLIAPEREDVRLAIHRALRS